MSTTEPKPQQANNPALVRINAVAALSQSPTGGP